MQTKIIKNSLVGGCLVFTSALMSAEQLLEVEDFGAYELGTGIVSNISCGNTNTVSLIGEKSVLDEIQVKVVNNRLSVERKSSATGLIGKLMGNNNNQGSVEANVVTRGQVFEVDTSTGSVLSIEGCAVNNSSIEINANTGSILTVKGETANLELNMSTGSQFNAKNHDFKADVVSLSMSTGSVANLCKSKIITGSASTGADIYAGAETDVSDVSLSLGADTSSRRCQ